MSDEEYITAGEEQRASTSATGAPERPSSRGQGAPRGIPLPPPFQNDGRESFQLWAHRYEVIQAARFKDSGVDLNTVLAAELPTRLLPELFIVWDNLSQETQDCYAEVKKCLQTAFGQKDVIASFQNFPNAPHRLPNEAMEVYAADVCRLVKEAFPDFEHNASEYMKTSRFIAGLDQEFQVKCHERGVKTFIEAFEIASQAEQARQAAKLTMPASSANVAVRDMGTAQSVNSVRENDTELRNAVQTLTTTVKDLSKDLDALKLKLDEQGRVQHCDRHLHVCLPHLMGGAQMRGTPAMDVPHPDIHIPIILLQNAIPLRGLAAIRSTPTGNLMGIGSLIERPATQTRPLAIMRNREGDNSLPTDPTMTLTTEVQFIYQTCFIPRA